MFLFEILALLSLLLCLGLGGFTIVRNPKSPANIGFMLGLLVLAAHEAGSLLIFLFDGAFRSSGIKILLVSQVLLPLAWLPFSSVFAKASQRNILSSQTAVFVLGAILSAFFIFSINSPAFIEIAPFSGSAHDGYLYHTGPLGRYFLIYQILGLMFNLIHLENTLRSSKGSKRWQIKYVIFGIGAVLAFFIYAASQALLFSSAKAGMLPLTSAVILISMSITAVFIVRHRLLDVDIFISRYVIYNSLTVLIVGLYFIIVGVIAHGVKFFGIPFNDFFSTLFIFVALLLLVISFFTTSLRRKFQLLISRHFYKHKYEFRDKWMETIEKISPKRNIEDIEATLKELISIDMCSKPVLIWVYDPVSKSFLSNDLEVPEKLKKFPADSPFTSFLRQQGQPFLKDGISGSKDSSTSDARDVFSRTGTVLCSPMMAGSELIGFVMQGPDMSAEPYRQDDFELLKAMTTQAAVQIKNIMLSQDIMNNREVEAFNKLSTFVMHDLKNLTNSLSLVSQNAKYNMDNPEFQKDALRAIDGTVQRMKKLIDRLSNLPKELEIRTTSVELHGFVQDIITAMPVVSVKPVNILNEIKKSLFIQIDPEAMEMVFINIISNACEAVSAGGTVTVVCVPGERCAEIAISDNGVGMEEEFMRKDLFKPFKTTRKNGLGIGLFQCKSIIEAHGGTIEVQSEKGKGTTFRLTIPS